MIKGTKQVVLSGTLWVWISSSGPWGHHGCPIGSLKVETTGQQLGLLPLSSQMLCVPRAGLAWRRVLDHQIREQAALFRGRQKPNSVQEPLCCGGSGLGAAGACDSCTRTQRLF